MRRPLQVLAAVVAGSLVLAATVLIWAPGSAAQVDASQCASRTQPPTPDAVVTLKDRRFNPPDVGLANAGMSVCWQHQDGSVSHTVTFDPPAQSPDSWPNCDAGESDPECFRQGHASHMVTFATPGTFKYRCKIHKDAMTGVVTVGGTQPTPPPTTPTTRPPSRTTTTRPSSGSTSTTVGFLTSSTTTSSTLVSDTTTSVPSTSSSITFTTQTTRPETALGANDDDDDPSGVLLAVGVLLLAAVVAALIPAWRRLT